MVDAGFTDPSYTEAMVEVVREMGLYIVLFTGLPIPHARRKMEPKRCRGTHLVTLEKPLNFGSPTMILCLLRCFMCSKRG